MNSFIFDNVKGGRTHDQNVPKMSYRGKIKKKIKMMKIGRLSRQLSPNASQRLALILIMYFQIYFFCFVDISLFVMIRSRVMSGVLLYCLLFSTADTQATEWKTRRHEKARCE